MRLPELASYELVLSVRRRQPPRGREELGSGLLRTSPRRRTRGCFELCGDFLVGLGCAQREMAGALFRVGNDDRKALVQLSSPFG